MIEEPSRSGKFVEFSNHCKVRIPWNSDGEMSRDYTI